LQGVAQAVLMVVVVAQVVIELPQEHQVVEHPQSQH
jgi:hypothetical protein